MITDFGGQNILAMTELFSKKVPVEQMSSDKKTLTYNTPFRKYRVRDKSSKGHDDLRQGIFDQLFLKSE
jgi:hypothetical protein